MKSFEELKMTGEYRPGRHGDCVLPIEIPPCPGDLSGQALAFWNVVTEEARTACTVTKVDGKALRLMAETWSLYLESMDDIAKNGIIVTEVSSQGVRRKRNPAFDVRSQCYDRLMRGLKDFGLTPRGRIGIHTGGQAGIDDDERTVMDLLGLGGRSN